MPGTRLNRWRTGFVVGGAIPPGSGRTGAEGREGRVQAGSFPGLRTLPQRGGNASGSRSEPKIFPEPPSRAVIRTDGPRVKTNTSQECRPDLTPCDRLGRQGSRSPVAAAASSRGGLSFFMKAIQPDQPADRTASIRAATRGSSSWPGLRARTRHASDLRMTPSDRMRR